MCGLSPRTHTKIPTLEMKQYHTRCAIITGKKPYNNKGGFNDQVQKVQHGAA